MDPVILSAVISIGSALAGGAIGAVGARQQASARNAAIQADASAAKVNANIAAQNAQLEGIRMQEQLAQSRRKFQLIAGTQQAQATALGMRGGSIGDLLADTDTQKLLERTSIIREGTYKQQGDLMTADALRTRATGMLSAQSSGTLEAVGSVVSGIGSAAGVASRFYGLGSSGSASTASGDLYGPGF